jgi:hypothetical protein
MNHPIPEIHPSASERIFDGAQVIGNRNSWTKHELQAYKIKTVDEL